MAQKRFLLGGEEFHLLDQDELTFAEARAIQKATGVPVGKFDGDDGAVVQGFLWVSMKRRKPEMKFADLDDVPMSQIEWAEDEESDEDADPTEGEENSPASD
jgi:hypothetical protein